MELCWGRWGGVGSNVLGGKCPVWKCPGKVTCYKITFNDATSDHARADTYSIELFPYVFSLKFDTI